MRKLKPILFFLDKNSGNFLNFFSLRKKNNRTHSQIGLKNETDELSNKNNKVKCFFQ